MENKNTAAMPAAMPHNEIILPPMLTKKEYAAIHILAGMAIDGNPDHTQHYVANAIKLTNELFKQLENENQNPKA